ncbi:Sec-independent protein translocase protein TatB [Pseudidiomarina taiwanensis]|uniref:Sec-independent protein translocase protein TatB n=1 Tax=Pseudidiomarina taiwanensis TaxID=337250 RepID=A0A432ZFN2_9GAMM|nr:Sec-independent protein translocase protein TatB [Pseudidiomarina taiwanensis]RUO76777.1 twin-arginine translocase subunit TatB [Pseudidiomarina taiwanensis]
MFDIGFWELILIAVLGLLVLGPERLPAALRSFQRMLAGVKAYGSKVQAELNHELRIKELHDHLAQAEQLNPEQLSPELQRSIAELKNAAAAVQRPYAKAPDNPSKEPKDGD